MPDDTNPTRRDVLRSGVAIGVASLGVVGTATAQGSDDTLNPGEPFGRVYANDELWRTNVVRKSDERFDPDDRIYFLHDGEKSIVARKDVSEQQSPFVSESAPGDRDWNGGKWTHFSAEVTDVGAFNEDAPLKTAETVLNKGYIDIELGRPGFGPPNFFICPLNGRA